MILDAHDYSHISTMTTTQVLTGPGVLKNVTINTTAAGAITIYDEIGSDTTHVVAIIAASVNPGTYVYNITVSRGIKVVTAAASDITVTYSV